MWGKHGTGLYEAVKPQYEAVNFTPRTSPPELGVHVGLKRTAGAAAGCPLAVLVRFCWHASVWERLQEAAHILNGSVTSCSVRWTDSPESAWAHEDWARVREPGGTDLNGWRHNMGRSGIGCWSSCTCNGGTAPIFCRSEHKTAPRQDVGWAKTCGFRSYRGYTAESGGRPRVRAGRRSARAAIRWERQS